MKRHCWRRWLLPSVGLASLVWFVLRVGPKPSRAAYPCQQVAGPLAGGFLLWLGGVLASAFAFREARRLSGQSRKALAAAFLVIAVATGLVALVYAPAPPAMAAAEPNAPMGVARGLFPGRVVWVHDPAATDWVGPGDGHWWESEHTNQAAVDRMMSKAIRGLGGEATDGAAWDALFRHFNRTGGRGDMGYTAGEKICIKVNLVGCIANGSAVDPISYNLISGLDYMNTSPQMMRALLRQLVYSVGVNPADISIGDPTTRFPNQFHDPLHAEFPTVRYLDNIGGNAAHPRTPVTMSSVPLYWSARPTGKTQDYVPSAYAQATYLINMANLKGHSGAGITLCGKNHYGSLKRYPTSSGYYGLHQTIPSSDMRMGRYRCMVDLMGHAHIGGKTVLYLIDGLYPGIHTVDESPRRWNSAPFNGDWTSSLFASQDPVAIDSVGFDFMDAEYVITPFLPSAEDYLREAAQADSPPSMTFYDPNHPVNTARLASLGTHEHWNNAAEKKYSRNLGAGDGIELVILRSQPGDFDRDGDVDHADFGHLQACMSGSLIQQTDPNCQDAKLNSDDFVDQLDLDIFLRCVSGSQISADPGCAD